MGRFLPTVAACDFCSFATCYASPTAEFGQERTVNISGCGTTMSQYGPPKRVYVENEWYDGPRAGIVDIGGNPHRFKSLWDDDEDHYLSTFLVWPVAPDVLKAEIDQWQIFVEWNNRYESGLTDVDTHPGHGGLNAFWDELEARLKASRTEVPADAMLAKAEIHPIERDVTYAFSGPRYALSWQIATSNG
jgi:hypothetical protein